MEGSRTPTCRLRLEFGCDRFNLAFPAFKTNTTNSASTSTYPQFANTRIVIYMISKILVILHFALFVLRFQGALSSSQSSALFLLWTHLYNYLRYLKILKNFYFFSLMFYV
ncbi:uncharacterized protein [Malus domestica]|uniref:uncharacterized protein isoform X8 n=1 Tax=Malus domestica TaxID=3750 RepID=UPI0039772127